MESIPIPIAANYVDWSWWHAVREIFQNAMDAHDAGHSLRFRYDTSNQTLWVINKGVRLPRNTLVLGNSPKKNQTSQRGGFGEGYKLALATLCRLGANVSIFNGFELWRPIMKHSDLYGSEILHIEINKQPTEYSDLIFSISGLPHARVGRDSEKPPLPL